MQTSRAFSAYRRPYCAALRLSLVHACCNTSLRCVLGVTLMTARRAVESMTTTCEADMSRRAGVNVSLSGVSCTMKGLCFMESHLESCGTEVVFEAGSTGESDYVSVASVCYPP